MARSYRLDTPRETRRSLRGNIDPETFGRLSERFARALGTARFLVYMSAFVLSWVLWNTFGPEGLRYDSPFFGIGKRLYFQDINFEWKAKWSKKIETTPEPIPKNLVYFNFFTFS
jgi:hypothetical protein